MFDTKDDKLSKMEKRLNEMEKKMAQNFERVNETISTLNEIIFHLQADNTKLRNEKDFLVERHKKLVMRVPVPDLSREINNHLVKPAANKIKENAELFRNAAVEGFIEIKDPEPVKTVKRDPVKELKDHVIRNTQSSGKTIDRLYELITENGRVRCDEAARRLNVHEIQVEEWGKILQEHELIKMKKSPFGKTEMVKL